MQPEQAALPELCNVSDYIVKEPSNCAVSGPGEKGAALDDDDNVNTYDELGQERNRYANHLRSIIMRCGRGTREADGEDSQKSALRRVLL